MLQQILVQGYEYVKFKKNEDYWIGIFGERKKKKKELLYVKTSVQQIVCCFV